jgi:hypothetical protein
MERCGIGEKKENSFEFLGLFSAKPIAASRGKPLPKLEAGN